MLSSDVNDLDRRFGEFCFSQVRGQLKGAYLPEERIYCIEAAGEDGNQVESLVRNIIDRGAWPSDDYQRLRDIGFVHETADSYRRTDSRDFIVGELERTLHNGRAGRLLEAYHDFLLQSDTPEYRQTGRLLFQYGQRKAGGKGAGVRQDVHL